MMEDAERLSEQVADFHSRWQTEMNVNQQQAEKIVTLQSDNERLTKQADELAQAFHNSVCVGNQYSAKLAAEQAYSAKLREALETCTDGDYSTGSVIDPYFDADLVRTALALPNDTTALDARLAQERERVVREYREYMAGGA